MIKKSTLQHLRIPFSFYLLPFFLFAVSQSERTNILYLILSFIIIHFLFYPASNGYNSYFDKDEESIGGLEAPPPVDKQLYYVSVSMEVLAVMLGFLISSDFTLMLIAIILASRAYSHPSVRLKKYPVIGLLTVAIFQGCWTYLMSYLAINQLSFHQLGKTEIIFPAVLCFLILLGSYPMTQVYQHGEDGRRGDMTISRMLGIRGTFLWTGIIFSIATAAFIFFFINYENTLVAIVFPLFLLPTLVYFLLWFRRVLQNTSNADFKSTMRLNFISAVCFVCFFTWLIIYKNF
ncbi:MAG: UbiA family prenyltransferase [Cytophagaceae bacterium]